MTNAQVYALIGAMRPRGQLEVVVNGNTHVSDQALSRLDRALDQVRTRCILLML
jgi:hypothetical protein